MPRIILLLGLAAAAAQQERFCLGGLSATHGPYRICCPAQCGSCIEDDQCRARPPGGLVCCPVSGVLASRRRCSRRKDAACYARDDDPEFFPWLAVDAVQRTQQPPSSIDGAFPWPHTELKETGLQTFRAGPKKHSEDVHVAVADICSEIGAAWGRLTRKERSRSKSPLRSPLRQVNAGDDKAWEPPAKQTSSALETADLTKLHKGKQAYLDRLVRKANF